MSKIKNLKKNKYNQQSKKAKKKKRINKSKNFPKPIKEYSYHTTNRKDDETLFKEQQKAEAIKRMKMLNLMPEVINDFKTKGKLYKSECGGILYWLDKDEQAIVKEFEDEYGGLVFHIIKDYTEFGKLLTLFYVCMYPEEWEYDKEDIKGNTAFCYVKNLDVDYNSEFGSIGFKSCIGGLVRTA